MCSLSLRNYWLDRIEKRNQEKAKQAKIAGIVNNVVKIIKGQKARSGSGK